MQSYSFFFGTLVFCFLATSIIESQAEDAASEEPHDGYACEGSTLTITCSEDKVINILEANYGRTNMAICNEGGDTEGWDLTCESTGSMEIVTQLCQSKQTCYVAADERLFGEPCAGTEKYLHIKYQCDIVSAIESSPCRSFEECGPGLTKEKPKTSNAVYACEGAAINIACFGDLRINILKASYGRSSVAICYNDESTEDWDLMCESPESLQIVREICQEKDSCRIMASNELFGDPCDTTPKYLEVEYRCLAVMANQTSCLGDDCEPESGAQKNGDTKVALKTVPVVVLTIMVLVLSWL